MKKATLRLTAKRVFTIFLVLLLQNHLKGQSTIPGDPAKSSFINDQTFQKDKSFKMTTLTSGGSAVNFTKVNGHFTIMTGGRGSATFNGRYTIGGGGWGMTKVVEVESLDEGIYDFVKLGYGGIDFGYLILPGNNFNVGTKLLVAGGAVFKESVPDSGEKGFKMFPVLEPSVYCQVSLSRLFRLETGASYRHIWGTDLPYISDKSMSGVSFFIGFLVSACTCK